MTADGLIRRTDTWGGYAAVLWYLAAGLAVASVLFLNGRALFYFDTPGYVDQGTVALRQLHLIAPDTAAKVAGLAGQAAEGVRTVDGSRSPFYSFLAGLFAHWGFLEALLLINAAALFGVSWLIARVVQRMWLPHMSRAALIAVPVIAASLGSLPFYAAYLMPDLLAPVMILAIAALAAFGADMGWGERLLAVVLGVFAIVSHLSHFAIGGLLFLAAVPVALFVSRRAVWVAVLGIGLILGAAWMQGKAFRTVAAKAAKSEVVIKPYITARLIQDGVGYDWLAAHCPDPAIATCALWEALHWSDDPYRLTASHITFETSQRLGSFRLMTPEDQKRVADDQVAFFRAVLTDMPVATVMAFVKNTLIQSAMFSVDMTLPTEKVEMRNADVTGVLGGSLVRGRLLEDAPWVAGLTRMQGAYYAASLGFALTLMVVAGALPGRMRAFALLILLGILANALVCGGISQPATRYGARVIWLLPWLAALLWMVTLHWHEARRR